MNGDGEAAATELWGKVLAVYAAGSSYLDEGSVIDVMPDSVGTERFIKERFSTAFVRPGQFRFEYRSQLAHKSGFYVVYKNNQEVRTWAGLALSENDLSSALCGANGVSYGAALRIPQILLPQEIRGSGIHEMKRINTVGEENCGDHACLKISGYWRTNGPTFIWIDQNHLIRKIEEKDEPGRMGKFGLRTRTVIEYSPQLNVPVAADKLAFGF